MDSWKSQAFAGDDGQVRKTSIQLVGRKCFQMTWESVIQCSQHNKGQPLVKEGWKVKLGSDSRAP